MRRAYQNADAIIAISSAVKGWLDQELGISTNKIKVIHYGIEADQFAPGLKLDQLGEDQQKDRFVIGTIGRLEPGKGFDCLIDAMRIVCKRVPNASLLIAGHDPWGYSKHLRANITALNLEERVQLVGFKDNVPSFLRTLQVFAFASRSEGFGQVVIEAMAAGVPVVVSRIPPLTEIVKDGETGLLVELDRPERFARAIAWLLMHRKEAEELGRRGQMRVWNQFSAEKMARETFSLYDQRIGKQSVH
jgi:glycosyltransferase involved in cell wall biosynthesis